MGWSIARCLKRLKRKRKRKRVFIKESYYSLGLSVFRVDDRNIPGSVELWKVLRYAEGLCFFLSIVNVRSAERELSELHLSEIDIAADCGRIIAARIGEQLQGQATIDASHYWVVGLSRQTHGIDRAGRAYTTERISTLDVYAVDLQGAAASYAGNKYALRFARHIVARIASNQFPGMERWGWEGAIERLDWLDWLERLARSPGGIDPNHRIQPRRR